MTDLELERLLLSVRDMFGEKVRISDMCADHAVSISERTSAVNQKLSECSGASLIITDRLHGMIFAAITGTPCIVMESLSSKIRGCYSWIEDCNYIRLCNDSEEIPAIWEEIQGKTYEYDNLKILPLYDTLIKKIKE